MTTRKDAIYRRVLKQISPSAGQRERMESTAREILKRARDWLADNNVDAGTPIETLQGNVESIAGYLGASFEKRFAQHPYVTFTYGGFDVDLVPCYRYSSKSGVISAVDRTPAHNIYIIANLRKRESDVLLLKGFLKSRGIYGSELRTQGFSGYLCELLIIYYGSFDRLLEAARGWRYGLTLNPANHHHHETFDDPLVVIDPTDSNRNVASALSVENMFRFVEASRDFVNTQTLEAFLPPPQPAMSTSEFRSLLKKRGMFLMGVVFTVPDMLDDVLYPQLRRSLAGIRALLERGEFDVHRCDAFAGDGVALLLFELLVWELPPTRRHTGPPVEDEEHARRFREKHPRAYIDGSRYVSDVPREHVTADDLLRAELDSAAHGTQLRESLKQGFDVILNYELWSARRGALRPHFAEFFQPFRE